MEEKLIKNDIGEKENKNTKNTKNATNDDMIQATSTKYGGAKVSYGRLHYLS